MNNSIYTVRVEALIPEQEMHPDDLEVAGQYVMSISRTLTPGKAAGAALDRFHDSIGIKVLDDFDISVYDSSMEAIEQDEDYEEGSLGYLATDPEYVGALEQANVH